MKRIKSSIPVSFLASALVVMKIPADNAFDLWIFLIAHEVYSKTLMYRLGDQDCIKFGVDGPLSVYKIVDNTAQKIQSPCSGLLLNR